MVMMPLSPSTKVGQISEGSLIGSCVLLMKAPLAVVCCGTQDSRGSWAVAVEPRLSVRDARPHSRAAELL
jgi:hypothetical protein